MLHLHLTLTLIKRNFLGLLFYFFTFTQFILLRMFKMFLCSIQMSPQCQNDQIFYHLSFIIDTKMFLTAPACELLPLVDYCGIYMCHKYLNISFVHSEWSNQENYQLWCFLISILIVFVSLNSNIIYHNRKYRLVDAYLDLLPKKHLKTIGRPNTYNTLYCKMSICLFFTVGLIKDYIDEAFGLMLLACKRNRTTNNCVCLQ